MKNINYQKLLFEGLRFYFSVNKAGQPSILYRYLSAFVSLFQAPFNSFDTFRKKEYLIANCKWQIGQLTNLLNYFYDNIQNRIYITQSTSFTVSDSTFNYNQLNNDSDFNSIALMQERAFNDSSFQTIVNINVPIGVNLDDLTATIEQIKFKGIPYQIQTF